jgi:hypothetical protein
MMRFVRRRIAARNAILHGRCGELAVLSDSILCGARFICSKLSTICRQTGLARRATPGRRLFAPTPPNALRNCKERDRKQGYRQQG